MSAPIYRPATPRDAEWLTEVFVLSRATAMPWLPVVRTPSEVHTWFSHQVIRGMQVTVAEIAEVPIAFIACTPGKVEQLYVAPAWQRRGIGKKLLDRAKRDMPQGFTLWVFQRNRAARDFYESQGLTCIQETQGQENEEHEPDALYQWQPA